MNEPPPSPDQQLAAAANSGADLVAACYAYIAELSTRNLAGALAGLYVA